MLPPHISEHFKGKRVLVTGGTGLVGREVCRLLVEMGSQVTSISMDNLKISPDINYWKVDLFDFNLCKKIIKDFDHVFHLAGVKGNPLLSSIRPSKFLVPILMMNTHVLEAARLNHIPYLLYTSSIGAYPPGEFKEKFIYSAEAKYPTPMDGYPGWAKLMGEMQIDAYRRSQERVEGWVVVRLGSTYGPGDNFDPDNAMVIPSLMAKITRGDNPLKIIGDGLQVRDFLYSTDAAVGIILASRSNVLPYVNIGSGKGHSIRQLLEMLQQMRPFRITYDNTNFHSNQSCRTKVLNTEYATEELNFVPRVSLKEGLLKTWNWYLANLEEHRNKMNYFV